jgi:hypothetical protein
MDNLPVAAPLLYVIFIIDDFGAKATILPGRREDFAPFPEGTKCIAGNSG